MSEKIKPKRKKIKEKSNKKKNFVSDGQKSVTDSTKILEIKSSSKDEIDYKSIKSGTFNPFPEQSNVKNKIKKETINLNEEIIEKEAKVKKKGKLPREVMERLEESQRDPLEKMKGELEKLSEIEKDVLDIAKKVLKKKKYESILKTEQIELMSPLVEQLYAKCIAKLKYYKGYSKNDIFSAIQTLKKKKWIVTDQRRTRKEIINSPILSNVLKFIQDHPGVHARDDKIKKEIGITRNPFIKHLIVLDTFGLIRTKKIGRTLNYFIKDLPDNFDEFIVMFSNPLVPKIIISFLKDQSIGISEIARNLEVYHGAIQYHINKMVKMAILSKSGSNITVNKVILKKYNELYEIPPFTSYM